MDAGDTVGNGEKTIEKNGRRFQYIPSLTGYQQTNMTSGYKSWPGRSDVAGYERANPNRNGAIVEYSVAFNASSGMMKIGGSSVSEYSCTSAEYKQVFDDSWLDIVPGKRHSFFEGWYYDLGYRQGEPPEAEFPEDNATDGFQITD